MALGQSESANQQLVHGASTILRLEDLANSRRPLINRYASYSVVQPIGGDRLAGLVRSPGKGSRVLGNWFNDQGLRFVRVSLCTPLKLADSPKIQGVHRLDCGFKVAAYQASSDSLAKAPIKHSTSNDLTKAKCRSSSSATGRYAYG